MYTRVDIFFCTIIALKILSLGVTDLLPSSWVTKKKVERSCKTSRNWRIHVQQETYKAYNLLENVTQTRFRGRNRSSPWKESLLGNIQHKRRLTHSPVRRSQMIQTISTLSQCQCKVEPCWGLLHPSQYNLYAKESPFCQSMLNLFKRCADPHPRCSHDLFSFCICIALQTDQSSAI